MFHKLRRLARIDKVQYRYVSLNTGYLVLVNHKQHIPGWHLDVLPRDVVDRMLG